jgi:hypothetical protein
MIPTFPAGRGGPTFCDGALCQVPYVLWRGRFTPDGHKNMALVVAQGCQSEFFSQKPGEKRHMNSNESMYNQCYNVLSCSIYIYRDICRKHRKDWEVWFITEIKRFFAFPSFLRVTTYVIRYIKHNMQSFVFHWDSGYTSSFPSSLIARNLMGSEETVKKQNCSIRYTFVVSTCAWNTVSLCVTLLRYYMFWDMSNHKVIWTCCLLLLARSSGKWNGAAVLLCDVSK